MRRTRAVGISGLTIICLAFVALTASAQTFVPPTNVSATPIYSVEPQIAVGSGQKLYLAWLEMNQSVWPIVSEVYLARSENGGDSFSTPVRISASGVDSWLNQVYADSNGHVYVLWEGYEGPSAGAWGIWFSASSDGAHNFSTPIKLSANDVYGWSAQMTVDSGGNVYVIWAEDLPQGGSSIYWSRSTDAGLSFSAPISMPKSMNWAQEPKIAVDPAGRIHAIWGELSGSYPPTGALFHSIAEAGAAAFSPPTQVSQLSGHMGEHQISFGPGETVNLFWIEASLVGQAYQTALLNARSTDGGFNFSAPSPIPITPSAGNWRSAQVASTGEGQIFLLLTDSTDIFYLSRSTDAGITFSSPEAIGSVPSGMTQIDVGSSGKVFILWSSLLREDKGWNWEIFFRGSEDAGINFGAVENVSNTPGDLSPCTFAMCKIAVVVQIAVSKNGTPYIVWEDSEPGNWEIYFSRPVNTPPGQDVVVTPIDKITKLQVVKLTYESVLKAGETTLKLLDSGPPAPDGKQAGEPQIIYDIATTAEFAGKVQVCIDYKGTQFGNKDNLELYHYTGAVWEKVTVSHDKLNEVICGDVTSLSPFAIFELDVQPSGLQAPLAALELLAEPANPAIPEKAFKQGSTLPFKFQLFSGSVMLSDLDVQPPQIVGLYRVGDSADLVSEFVDAGQANDNGTLFRFSDGYWIYNLSTKTLAAGSYLLTIQMPDGGRYKAAFVLK